MSKFGQRWQLIGCALIFAISAVPATANGRVSPLSGIFSDVFEHPESGDLLGLEIELHADTPTPYALVVYCEGWCNEFHRVPIKLDVNRFSLHFSERLIDSSGKPDSIDRYEIDGRLIGGALVGKLHLTSESYSVAEPFHLKRRKKRFGLNVAKPAPSE